MRESYQQIRLSLYISWEPGSQVPSEFAALVHALLKRIGGLDYCYNFKGG